MGVRAESCSRTSLSSLLYELSTVPTVLHGPFYMKDLWNLQRGPFNHMS